MSERIPRWLIAAVVAVLVASGAVLWVSQRDALGDDVAVSVGDHEITKDDLADRSRALQALYGVQKPAGGDKLDEYWRDLAKSVVLAEVLDLAASSEGITISDAAAEEALRSYIERFYGGGDAGVQAFTQALGDAGSSRAAVLTEISRQLQVSKLFESVTASVAAPTVDEIATAYDERRCQLEIGEQRELRNIVTATRADAEAARARVEGGESFASVARAASQDGSTANKGGSLGAVTKDQLEKAYGNAAFSAGPGELFGPVRTRFGWNLGLVLSAEPARTLTLEQASDALSHTLLGERRSEVWHDWIADQLRDAGATYADDYRPEDPAAPPAGFDPSPAAETEDC